MRTRILITGATGFVGSHVVRSLTTTDADVYALARPEADLWRLADLGKRLHWVEGNLSNPQSVLQVVERVSPSVVIHCAAYGVDNRQQDAQMAIGINVLGTQALLDASAAVGVQRFIHTGTCFEYGSKDHPITEKETLGPLSSYGASKAASTLMVIQQTTEKGLAAVVLRLFGMYGPYEGVHKFIPQVIHACLNGTPLDLTGGEQIRDYTYVQDVASLYARLALGNNFPAGEIFNISSGKPITIRELGTKAARLLNRESVLRWGALPYRHGEIKMLVGDITKAQQKLNWQPVTNLQGGLHKTVDYYRQNKEGIR